jgi:hypothetical protein
MAISHVSGDGLRHAAACLGTISLASISGQKEIFAGGSDTNSIVHPLKHSPR